MSENALCPACANWRQASGERFCGLCGAGMDRFDVMHLYAFSSEGEPDRGLKDGQLVFRITPLPEREGPAVPLALRIDQTGQRMAYDLTRDIEAHGDDDGDLRVDRSAVAGQGPVSGQLVQEADDGTLVRVLAHFGISLPRPEFDLAPELVSLTEEDLRRKRTRLRLRCTDGLLAPVERVLFEDPKNPDDPGLVAHLERNHPDGTFLRPGEEAAVDISFDQAMVDELRNVAQGLRRTASVVLYGFDRAPMVVRTLRFQLYRPPKPVLHLPPRIEAMAGAGLYLPIRIENRGSAPLRLDKIGLEPEPDPNAKAAPGRSYAGRSLNDRSIAAGESYAVALDVRPDGNAADLLAEPGPRNARLTLSFANPNLDPVQQRVHVSVRAERECADIITIDFGTTESAAALLDDAGHREPVALQIGDEGNFVPTVVAYRADKSGQPVPTVGAPARELARTHEGLDLQYFDNIKWQLANPERQELPGGEWVDWTRITGDYIVELKRRIEAHPEVAARVTEAYVTRPARFDGRAIGALKAAFRYAGIEPLQLAARDTDPTTISESWPPVIAGLARPNLRALRRQALADPETIFGADPTGAVHHLLTVDVGGGSSDLSAFEVDYQNHADIWVHERASAGSDSLAGNHLSDWLYRNLIRPSLLGALSAAGFGADDVPVHFRWQSLPEAGVSHVQDRNGLALARVVFDLQRHDGPIRDLLARVEQAFAEAETDPSPGPDRTTATADLTRFNRSLFDTPDGARPLWDQLTEIWRQIAYVPAALSLWTRNGHEVEIEWPATGLDVDFARLMPDFQTRFREPMRNLLAPLVAALDTAQATDRSTQVLISGRGSLFPLFGRMLLAEVARVLQDRPHEVRTIEADMAKAITSVGGCYLAQLVSHDPNVRFVAHVPDRLALLGGADPRDSRKRQAIPFTGASLQDTDGLLVARVDLPPGRARRTIELAMVADTESSVEVDGTRVIARIRKTLDVSPGPDSYVVVRALDAERIEVGVGLAASALSDPPQESDFDSLTWLAEQHLPRD